MRWTWAFAAAAGWVFLAGSARADDDVRAELEALKRQVREQERKIRELEGTSLTRDEVSAAIDRYLEGAPAAAVLVGGEDAGKAGFPLGKKPFVQQGPNKLEIGARWQVRYSAFLYSDDAVGTVSDDAAIPTFYLSDAAPRDRSGFELERLLLDLGGSIFCEDLTYLLQVDFDADSGSGVQKRSAWLDWKYCGNHHLRAGADRVPFGYEPNNSSGALAFVDRGVVGSGFDLGWHTGVSLWGNFGDCDCPKRFLYKVSATNGEGRIDQEGSLGLGSVFNRDARDTFSDELLFTGMLEWNLTCDEFKWDEVDNRDGDKRCKPLAAVGVSAYHENDDDSMHSGWGNLLLRSTGRAERTGLNAWFRAHWNGWSFVAEGYRREVDYTAGSSAPTQTDLGVHALLHYRFPDSCWGLGVRAGVIWLDDDYDSIAVNGVESASIDDTVTEIGFVVNWFAWNHNHKVTFDVNWVQDNSAVSSTTQGYLVDPKKGVVVEEGVMLRLQWQVMF